MIDTHSLIGLVSNIGFPILLCMYLLLRFEKKLSENTKAIEQLSGIIKTLTGIIEGCCSFRVDQVLSGDDHGHKEN